MVKIASHHLPGHPLPSPDAYNPLQAWPDDVTVQWGDGGLVLGETSYTTAFFEAFPESGGFIRGEGKNIEDAEADAFGQFQRETACEHAWSRKHYTNGGGICLHCGGFRSNVFPAIVKLGDWKSPPPTWTELNSIISGWLRLTPRCNTVEGRKHIRRRYLRARVAGIALPETPDGMMTDDQFLSLVRDPYREACREAVATWLKEDKHDLSAITLESLWRSIEHSRASDSKLTSQ